MAHAEVGRVEIEVVYAEPDRQVVIALSLEKGATVGNAIARSGIAAEVPDVASRRLGIFSRIVTPNAVLQDGDRVEVYRALLVDPKDARRRRGVRHK